MKHFWRFVWNASEFLHLPLGRFAPFAFGKMIGCKGVEVKKTKKGTE